MGRAVALLALRREGLSQAEHEATLLHAAGALLRTVALEAHVDASTGQRLHVRRLLDMAFGSGALPWASSVDAAEGGA